MWYTIPYSIFPCGADPSFPTGHTAKRPALQLDLLNGSKRLSGFAIIDSGADHCIFPLSFATQLGLDPLAMKGSSVAGLGGVSNTLYWPVRLEFPGTTLQLDVYAGFSASMDAIGPVSACWASADSLTASTSRSIIAMGFLQLKLTIHPRRP
jgi:hypothetical protein